MKARETRNNSSLSEINALILETENLRVVKREKLVRIKIINKKYRLRNLSQDFAVPQTITVDTRKHKSRRFRRMKNKPTLEVCFIQNSGDLE